MARPDESPEREEGRGSMGELHGGGARVPEHPPDTPGGGRTTMLGLITILAILLIGVPVAWRLGALVFLGDALGAAASVAVWIIWAVILLALVWVGLAMWRSAA
ncbi:MAG TPA: hypothetical protein VNZ57_00935 [Longimicrobiales bacterium]|nr:hypothetical protein [Longimicrobiales bacterium]